MPRPASRPVRFLLDENLDEDVALILQGLGHEATHVRGIGRQGQSDADLVDAAGAYDVFVTLDLHRQEAEFLAVNESMIRGDVKILRVRLPREGKDLRLVLTQSLVRGMDKWLREFMDEGKVLVTISAAGTRESAKTAEQVMEILDSRKASQE